MSSKIRLSVLALAASLFLGAIPAQAAKLGPYFPLPKSFPLSGPGKTALLKIQADWLQNGLENLQKAEKETTAALEKAKADNAKPEDVAKLEEKLKTLDADIKATEEEIGIENNDTGTKEEQAERKRLFMLNVNQWINELGRLATEQLKIAILKDGMEAQVAENQHARLSEQADAIERAKNDTTVVNWAISR
ncbi:MAG: hypothetical protein ABSD90_10645 [Methylocystis sp.]|jgi:hypothetical protein